MALPHIPAINLTAGRRRRLDLATIVSSHENWCVKPRDQVTCRMQFSKVVVGCLELRDMVLRQSQFEFFDLLRNLVSQNNEEQVEGQGKWKKTY